jgi:hypothetical protein
MKKIYTIINLLLVVSLLNGCQNQITGQDATNNLNKPDTQSTEIKSNEIKWETFDKNFIGLSGIKYPDGFIVENDSSKKEFNVFDRLVIKSSKSLDLFNCEESFQCEKNGMQISIFSSKATVSYRDTDLNLTDETTYPNIKKIKSTNALNANGVITNEYIFIPNESDEIAYQITFTERNFDGDSAVIIEGILGSLHNNLINWIKSDKKYGSLEGIKYPDNFYINEMAGAIVISSAENPFVWGNNDSSCFLAKDCDEISGMEIDIYGSLPIDGKYLEDTKFAKIKKIQNSFTEQFGGKYAYNRDKYLFIGASEQYMIDAYIKNYTDNPAAIIDGILDSLQE